MKLFKRTSKITSILKEPLQERDIFIKIRNLGRQFTLTFRLILIVGIGLLISLIIALGLDEFFTLLLGELIDVPDIIELGLIGILVAIFSTYFISRWLIDPLQKVGPAMDKISNGDYSVRLETKNNTKEIQEIYTGFNMMAKELESTEIIQTDFISNVSHEFKTPIAAIEGYSMLLQDDDNLTEEQKEYIEKIILNANRLSSLTGSVLLLSKIENQSIVPNKTHFDLDEQIRQSILLFESEWERKNIDFNIELDDTDYLGNETLLHHIWDNLISNAIKFSPHGGIIHITLSNFGQKIVFSISDQGPGISDEVKNHIFDKFYQADSSHKQYGNGLGLALAKKIVDLEGGEIFVMNNEDAGCRFTVILNK